MQDTVGKSNRVLYINCLLLKGEQINLTSIVNMFGVSRRTALRDVEEVKAFYADSVVWGRDYQTVNYDADSGSYKLKKLSG